MKRLLIVLMVCLASQASLMAQDSKTQVFGGFSAFRIGGSQPGSSLTPLGWQAAIEAKMAPSLSVVGDFGGQYKSVPGLNARYSFYQYMGGVRYHVPVSKVGAFAHALVGGGTVGGGGASASAFTMGYGGGMDVSVNDGWSVRVVQADWIPSHSNGFWRTNQFRFGFGLVWKAGS